MTLLDSPSYPEATTQTSRATWKGTDHYRQTEQPAEGTVQAAELPVGVQCAPVSSFGELSTMLGWLLVTELPLRNFSSYS